MTDKKLITKTLAIIAILAHMILLPIVTQAQFGTWIDTFKDNTCKYCYSYTSGIFVNGVAVLVPATTTGFGYITYGKFSEQVRELMLTTIVQVANDTQLAIWLTQTDPVPYMNTYINQTTDLRKTMVGAGAGVAIYRDTLYIIYTDVNGTSRAVTMSIINIAGMAFLSNENASRYQVTIRYSYMTSVQSLIIVSIGTTTVWSGAVGFFIPAYATILAGGTAYYEDTYVDYVAITASRYSAYQLIIPPITIEYIAVSSVYITPINSSTLMINYLCYWVENLTCTPIQLVISNVTTVIYNETIAFAPTKTGVYVYTDYVNVSSPTVSVEIYVNGTLVEKKIIYMPVENPLLRTQLATLLMTLIIVGIVGAMILRTSSLRDMGIGFIAGGIILLLAPYIGLTNENIYTASILLLALGALILLFFKSS